MFNEKRNYLLATIRTYLMIYNASKLEHYLDRATDTMHELKLLNQQNEIQFRDLKRQQNTRDEFNEFLNETIVYNKVA